MIYVNACVVFISYIYVIFYALKHNLVNPKSEMYWHFANTLSFFTIYHEHIKQKTGHYSKLIKGLISLFLIDFVLLAYSIAVNIIQPLMKNTP